MKCEGICECKIYEEPIKVEGGPDWLDMTILLCGAVLLLLLSAVFHTLFMRPK